MGASTEWLTVAKAARAEGIAERTMREKIKAKKVKTKKAKSKNGGGAAGNHWLVDPSSLSPAARKKLLKEQQAALYKEALKKAQVEPDQPGPKKAACASGEPAGAGHDKDPLNPAAYRDAVGNETYEKELARARSKHQLVNQAVQIQLSKQDVTQRLAALAEVNGISEATLYRMIKKSKEGGVFGQMRKRQKVTKGKTFRAISPEAEVIFREYYLRLGEPKAAACYRKMKAECQSRGLAVPSEQTMYRYVEYLEKTEPDLCCYARQGERAWFEKFAPHAVREEPELVMQVVMGDHHEFDLFIEHGGKAVRPWLTGFMDVKSRCMVGYTISLQPNSQTINLALVNMMSPKKMTVTRADGSTAEEIVEMGGIPGLIYIDNGEDYKAIFKKRRSGKPEFELSEEALDICEKLGVDVTFALPYRPESKAHIERAFGTYAIQFSREQPGWCGSNPDERPEGYNEKKLLAEGKLHTMVTLAEAFKQYFWEHHNAVHGGIGMAPLKKHLAGPKIREGWPDQRTLDILRTTKEKVRVYKEGIKKFGTSGRPRYYWHDDLIPLVGRDVIIRYDQAQIGELHVFTQEDGYVCTATNKELLSWNATREDYKKLAKQRATAKKSIKERLQSNSLSLEEIASRRQAAGEDIISAPTGSSAGMVPAITGLDQAGRQIARAREQDAKNKVAELKPKSPKHDPIDEYILRKGARA